MSGLGINASLSAQCNTNDFAALRAMYFAMDGDNWSDTTGWSVVRNNQTPPGSCDLSTLTGITVNNNDRVSMINLQEGADLGHIPSEIGDFEELTHLTLSARNLSGNIPPEIGNLSNLQVLDLSNNELSGSIPAEIGNLDQLTSLSLRINNLSGVLPSEIGNLIMLTNLQLSANLLTGPIPPEIGNLTDLSFLIFDENQFSSGIPPEIGELINLSTLNLRNNNLSGSIPKELGNLTNLDEFILSTNNLDGCFDPNLKNLCSQLTTVNIDPGNNFNDTWANFCASDAGICDCITGDWKALNKIYNDLNGPSWTNINTTDWMTIGSNTSPPAGFDLSAVPGIRIDSDGCVDSIRLRNKNLTGTLPVELGIMFRLQSLDLARNNISGTIIDDLGNLPALQDLRLQQNALSGSINSNGFENLKIYSVSNNLLDMPIPEDIDRLSRLQVLAINNNPLGGGLPTTLGQLQNLKVLHADSTDISGCFPPNLKKLCSQLTDVSIDSDNALDASWAGFCAMDLGVCGPCDDEEEACEDEDAIWEGRISSDWHVPDNWLYYSVPDSSDNVIIPTDMTVHIYSNQLATIESIIIDDESTLSIYYSASLNLVSSDADLRNDGTLNLEGDINILSSTEDEVLRNHSEFYITPTGRLTIESGETCLENNGIIENEGFIITSQCIVGIYNNGELNNDGNIIVDSTDVGISNAAQIELSAKNDGQTKMMPMAEIGNASDGIIKISNSPKGIVNDDEFYNDGVISIQGAETAIINGIDLSSGVISKEDTQTKSLSSDAVFNNSYLLFIDHCTGGIINIGSLYNEATIELRHIDLIGIKNLHETNNVGIIRIDSSGMEVVDMQPFFIGIINGDNRSPLQEANNFFLNEGSIEINEIEGAGLLNFVAFTNEDALSINASYGGIFNIGAMMYGTNYNLLSNQGTISIHDTDTGCIHNTGKIENIGGGFITLSQPQSNDFALEQDSIGTFVNKSEIYIDNSGHGHMSIGGSFTNQDGGDIRLTGSSTHGFLLRSSGHWINELNSILDISIETGDNVFEIESGGQLDGDYEITLGVEEE